MNERLDTAFWKGFMKVAMMHPVMPPVTPPAPKKPAAPAQMAPPPPPQLAQIQQLMRSMPMQQQQSFERGLAGQFGLKGQNFQMNPSAHL